ncbi:hypothetical protein E3N88_18776 [Mikania micrantha]|uniref:CCHC-type domain-containing protein n=1 Tax=Mikania micrantha TaxID=192012 RepID=A0A5N6NN18_9ASTR|nr:hypothetical protein E3N88_18776 [Mikania micrantha]
MANKNSTKEMTSKFDKFEKFEGQDFRRWHKKMHFLLTTLKVVYVLSPPIPEILEDGNLEQIRKRSKWENDYYICLGHILNGMCDALFDIYQNVETTKVLWDTLEAKYMAEDSSRQFTQHDMKMDELIQVSSIIDKLPPSWKDYKHNLKYHKGELTLVELGSHFRIEETLRGFEKTWVNDDKKPVGPSSVNLVEEGGSSKNNHKLKGKRKFQGKYNKGSNKKHIITCWKCGKVGHFKKDCRVGKHNKEAGPSGSKDPNKQQDLRWFKDFQPIEDGSVIKMGNVATEPIKGLGKVKLVFTSGKCLCLDNVLYVPGIQKNLLSGIMLNNCGYKQVLESDKFILSRHGTFVGFGYLCNGMFKLNLDVSFSNESVCMNSTSSSVGIIHQTTAPYTPQQNGVSERKNRVLKEMVNSMLSNSSLSEGFWGEAMLTVCYLLNRVPNKRNKITPYELWYGKPPNLNYVRIWGCRAIVRLNEPKRKNLGERGIDCIFIGYAEHSKAYRFYVIEPNDYVSVNTVVESRDAIFDEERFSSTSRPKDMIVSSSNSEEINHKEIPSTSTEPRRSKRARIAKDFDPKIYNEVRISRDVAFWKEATNDEMDSIMQNNTWRLTDLPPGCKPLGCKWIFKKKMKVDGSIDKFKARLVIQGFRQKEGIDYFDTYTPVARISTIILLIALGAIHNLVIHQMDVKTAFLNGDLDEEIYMKQPEGFVLPGNEHKVCKLVKSLYGLKQAPKQWQQKFDDVVLSSGYVLNQSDKCVYSKFDNSGKGVIICLYVDDMLIFSTSKDQVDKTKQFLSSKFSMKDMGEAENNKSASLGSVELNNSITEVEEDKFDCGDHEEDPEEDPVEDLDEDPEEDPEEDDPEEDPQDDPEEDPQEDPQEDPTEESSYRMPPRFRASKRPRFESDDIARLTWESKRANDRIEHLAQELKDEEELRADIAEGRLIALEEQFVSDAEEEEEEIPAQDVDSDADSTIKDA